MTEFFAVSVEVSVPWVYVVYPLYRFGDEVFLADVVEKTVGG